MTEANFESIAQLIKYRRSVFPPNYISREIPKTLLTELLECANAAPTHKLTQPWRFVVFHNNGLPRLAAQLSSLYKQNTPDAQFLEKKYENTREKVLQSGAVIAIIVSYSGAVPPWEEIAATACAVQNLWLAAASAGIGGYWSSPGTIKQMTEFLSLDGNEECLGFFYMGYHEESPRLGNRKPITEKIRWEE